MSTDVLDRIRANAPTGRFTVLVPHPEDGAIAGWEDPVWDDVSVDAEDLADLLLDPDLDVHRRGIGIIGLRLDGDLDLAHAELPFALALVACQMERSAILLHETTMRTLSLSGSHCGALSAYSARIRGSLVADEGFRCDSEVNLQRADVEDHLVIAGGSIGDGRRSLSMDQAHVGGNLVLRDGLVTRGQITLLKSRVDGGLRLHETTITVEDGYTLVANGAEIAANALLSDVVAEGGIILNGAAIGGQLSITSGTIRASDGAAITAEILDIAGGFFLDGGAEVHGGIRLNGSRIRGELRLIDADVRATAPSNAIMLQRVVVDGSVVLGQGLTVEGKVHLAGAQVLGQLLMDGIHLRHGEQIALDASDAHLDTGLFLVGDSRIEGEVSLFGAQIGGQVSCEKATLTDAETGMRLDGATLTGDAFFTSGFRSEGTLRLLGAKVSGDLSVADADLAHPTVALMAERLILGDSVYFRAGACFRGSVNLNSSTIGGSMVCTGLDLSGAEGGKVVLDGATFGGSILLIGSHLGNEVSIEGARVSGDVRVICGPSAAGTVLAARGASIDGALSLRGQVPLKGLDLRNARAAVIDDEEAAWPEVIDVTGFRFDALEGPSADWKARRRWLQRQPEPGPKPYLQLANVYRSAGHEAEARTILMERHTAPLRRDRPQAWRATEPGAARRLGRQILRATIGHGYAPWRVLYLLVPLLIGMSLWYAHAEDQNMLIPTRSAPKTTSSSCTKEHPCVQPLVYAVDTLLPVVDLGQRSRWTPDASTRGKHFWDDGRWLSAVAWTTSLLGWALTTLIVAGFSGIVRRE